MEQVAVVIPGAVASYSAKSALFSTTVADRGYLFDCTGSFTITLGTTSLSAGWSCWIRNISGTQTLDPSGAVTINGAATYALSNAGDDVLVMFDGTNFIVSHSQRPSTVAITGGTIEGTPIGGVTAAAGTFTAIAGTGLTITGTGSVTSTLSVGNGSGSITMALNGAAATQRNFSIQSGGSNRWIVQCTSTAESGSNAGSALAILARDDSAAAIDTPVTITRASGGSITLTRPLALSTASSGLTISITTGTSLAVSSTQDSTTKDTGCAVFEGGVGIEKALNVGGAIFSYRTDNSSAISGSGTHTLTGASTDGFVSGINLVPAYTGAFTVTRYNYINLTTPSLAGSAALTDACVFRFPSAAGTHKAVDSGTTKTTPGTVDAWVKININGTLYYMPCYTSKTT